MLRNVIASSKTVEIYQVNEDLKRGMLVVKNLSTETASKANDEGVDVYVVDADNQPTGHLADVDVPQYELDNIEAGSYAILVTYGKGGQFATDQVNGDFAIGDYAIASNGLFAPAKTGDVSKFRYVGEYQDGERTLQRFEVVEPVTIA